MRVQQVTIDRYRLPKGEKDFPLALERCKFTSEPVFTIDPKGWHELPTDRSDPEWAYYVRVPISPDTDTVIYAFSQMPWYQRLALWAVRRFRRMDIWYDYVTVQHGDIKAK